MTLRVKNVARFTLLVCVSAVLTFALLGHVGSSGYRIGREHGLKLPPSARQIACRGNAWMHSFSDCDAVSVFEMASGDVTTFVSQLTGCKTHQDDFFFPVDSQYEIPRAWMSTRPIRTYTCKSPVNASAMDVKLWQINSAHVGVLLYSDWN
jgi:hypothetical protein